MEYRGLGKTGIRVSSVGIGCLQFGGDHRWTGITDEESIATIHAAEGLGINLLDTARSYGDPDGHSEEVIGMAVHDRRDRYVIASKFRPITDDPDESRAREEVFEACEGSLARMRTDYIDVYQLHSVPHERTMPAVMDALAALKVQGKVRWFGISNNDVGAIRKLLALGDISVLQVGYNLLSRSGQAALNAHLSRWYTGAVERKRFERLVGQAVQGIPDGLLSYLDNVDIVIEDWPASEQLAGHVIDEEDLLLGLYEGVPLTERADYGMVLPDKITIYQKSIEAICANDEEVLREVRDTVVHEVAHHFGIDDERLEELGARGWGLG